MDNSNSKFRILVVDDEDDILEFVGYNLKKEDYKVFTASNGKTAIKIANEVLPHLILLDVMMPEMDGIETCEQIRALPGTQNTIIAFLTARSEDYSQVAGFEAGGDDYITKPVRPKVLISRIKALLKRYGSYTELDSIPDDSVLKFGELQIDKERHQVIFKGNEIDLPKKEFKLLLLLTSRPSRVFTRDEIFDNIWGSDVLVGDRTIDVYIRKLREKIGLNVIKTIKGVGYKFEV
ncbi:MAG TPA: response regulator transcription factor [Bacteroidales bacterium]|nr:response regulator transcription factor [Bacteroidales bacterium]